MEQPYDQWNQQKKRLQAMEARRLFKQRDIWWCALGYNIGDETQGKGKNFARPVLIYRKFNAHIFIGFPLTTKIKESAHYHYFEFHGRPQALMLSQPRVLDAKRLIDRMGQLPESQFDPIRDKVCKMLG
jgi:mRNA interferase MazF